jgi:hypothetical protein
MIKVVGVCECGRAGRVWRQKRANIKMMESVSEGQRAWLLRSLEGGVSRQNRDIRERVNHNSGIVPYLEYYSPKYSCDPRSNSEY